MNEEQTSAHSGKPAAVAVGIGAEERLSPHSSDDEHRSNCARQQCLCWHQCLFVTPLQGPRARARHVGASNERACEKEARQRSSQGIGD
ncbi:hypothetical protein MRX96_030733 [Rhipicephalus microplus]